MHTVGSTTYVGTAGNGLMKLSPDGSSLISVDPGVTLNHRFMYTVNKITYIGTYDQGLKRII